MQQCNRDYNQPGNLITYLKDGGREEITVADFQDLRHLSDWIPQCELFTHHVVLQYPLFSSFIVWFDK